MKKRKLLALLCAGMFAVGTFTACAGEADTSTAVATTTTSATTNAADTAEATETEATAAETVTEAITEITTEPTTTEASADTTAAETTAAETTTEEQMTTTTTAATTAAATEKAELSVPVLSDSAKDIVLTAENVKLVGRTYLDGDTLWAALSGAGAEFVYTGKKLEITLVGDNAATAGNNTNQARVGVYVDGVRVVDEMLDAKEKTVTAFESDTAKTVTVQIIKLSECANSTCGIKPIHIEKGEGIAPTAARKYKIEFIGDSITCGYGVDDEVKEHHFSTETEDVTRAYAYKTAQKLDADYSLFSISGYGIISGYTDNGEIRDDQTLPQYYESLGFSYQQFAGTTAPQSVAWDFDNFKPDVIVINLGTNDNSYCKDNEKKAVFQAAYVEFIKDVRKNNPDATIMCTLGIMGGDVSKNIKLAVDEYSAETGDTNITMFRLTQQSSSDGYAADWHPTEKTHEKASNAVVKQIKAQMGW